MSLLERLGRPNRLEDQKAIFAERKNETNEDGYQQMKLEIHRRLVDELSADQQKLLTKDVRGSAMGDAAEKLIADYCQRVLDEHPFAIPR